MPHSKLIALTHCARASLIAGNWSEFRVLLKERESLISELMLRKTVFTESQKDAIREADQMLQLAALDRKRSTGLRLRKIWAARRVRETYRV